VTDPEHVEFRADDRSAVVARMAELARDRNGWVNVQPALDPDDAPPPPSRLFGLFSGRGPDVPIASWVPGERRRNRVEPTCVGLRHGAGPRAVPLLAEAGHRVPPEWRVLQDHRRRGFVAAIPDDSDLDGVLRWLVAASTALTEVPLTGMWRAAIYVSSRARSG